MTVAGALAVAEDSKLKFSGVDLTPHTTTKSDVS
jgi:hypothetical protein